MTQDLFPPAIIRPDRNLAELTVEIKTAHHACEATMKTAVEKGRKAGELLLEAKEKAGHGNWEKWVKDNLTFSLRTAKRYMALAKSAKSATVADSLQILVQDEDTEKDIDTEHVHSSADRPSSNAAVDANRPGGKRSGLWDSAPAGTLERLPGGDKLSPIAKLPDLLLNHLKNFTKVLSDFSRCYDLPADAGRLGERLKAVRDWATEHVPKATLKPRKPSYTKRCIKCMYEIQMTMKEDYGWAPLDVPNDEWGHWEVIDDVAYFRKTAKKGFRTDHRRTCPKAESNKPLPD